MITLTIIWGRAEEWPDQTIQLSPNDDGIAITTKEGVITIDRDEMNSLIVGLTLAQERLALVAVKKPH